MDKILICILITLSLSQVIYLSPVLDGMQLNDVIQEEEDSEINATNHLIDEIKSRILKSLDKMEAPKSHVPLPTLQTLCSGDECENKRELIASETTTHFLLADVENISLDSQPGFKIQLDLRLANGFQSESAELWLYKKEDISEFFITRIISTNNEENETFTTPVYNQTYSSSWTRFDVSHMITATNLEFHVSAANRKYCLEVEGNKKPFLLIHKVSTMKSISKRSASDCTNESSTCCREKYYVKFKDIGWSDWIVEPEGYEANYCTGSCIGNIDLLSSHHARVINALCENNPQKAKEIRRTECVSCTSTASRPISVIYLDEQGVQVVSHLPGMSVTECGCA